GASTADVPRPLVGSVPYGGAGIFDCVTPGTVAFTFDDGPYLYTEDVLDKFKRYNAKATFFITGNNLGKGPIDSTPAWSKVIKSAFTRYKSIKLTVIDFDVDTAGYLNTDVSRIQKSKDIWDSTIAAADPATSNFLEIEHDIHYQIAYNLTDHILDSMYSRGFRSVTVGECLGDPPANWYRPGN
ncbi:putative peptidoglycan-N-acetylglucosamine deacetylase, partial [Golovinomyces cichoracearum]